MRALLVFGCVLVLMATGLGFDPLSRGIALDDSNAGPDTVQRAAERALHELLAEVDFRKLYRMPQRWKAELAEPIRKRLLVLMLDKLSSAGELKMKNYSDMFIPSRVSDKKMPFHGHGLAILQDLFLENGRCAWAIEQMLDCKLPAFSEELKKDKKRLSEAVLESHRKVVEALRLP